MKIIREDVARYISERDGHPADPEFIILTAGGAQGIQVGDSWLTRQFYSVRTPRDSKGETPLPPFQTIAPINTSLSR